MHLRNRSRGHRKRLVKRKKLIQQMGRRNMAYYLIDFENVKSRGMEGVELLAEEE